MKIRVFVWMLWSAFCCAASIAQEVSTTSATETAIAITSEPDTTQSDTQEPTQEPASADTPATSSKQSSPSRPKKAKTVTAKPGVLQPTFVYVAPNCDACSGLLKYLRQAGVVLSIDKVDRGNCTAFPTVIYSDGQTDHGERIYTQKVPLPRKLRIQECESGA
ncbi:MAG: hypothetical protein ACR2IE_13115 [Candidatus Sumerlaeaceae bacterium]